MVLVKNSAAIFVVMSTIWACSRARVNEVCPPNLSGEQLYYPFAGRVCICDGIETVKSKIPKFNIDDSFNVPDFEQYLLFQDTILSSTKVRLSAVAGFDAGKLVYFNLHIKAKEKSEDLSTIQENLLAEVKELIVSQKWTPLSDSEFESSDKHFRLTVRYDLSALRILEVTYRSDNWPV
ncbi:hypothetical protein [Chryseolinea lacunae]|uniref:Secreted protein n=1 Tax=Chryseolinea lacunae TaxID=2801331 RepID=A0ABS1L0I4_9BACT|nr:hypothetical protein [Chryseolinea lacunae]MBL0744973.1 hypothetical protein [Chryseolinea lacunae]